MLVHTMKENSFFLILKEKNYANLRLVIVCVFLFPMLYQSQASKKKKLKLKIENGNTLVK